MRIYKTSVVALALALMASLSGVALAEETEVTLDAPTAASDAPASVTGSITQVVQPQPEAGVPAIAQPPQAPVSQPVAAPPKVLQAADYVHIQKAPADVKGYKTKQYHAVSVTIQNTQPAHIEIVHAEVLNGIDEALVAQQKAQSSQRKRQVAGGFLRLAGAVPGFGPVLGSAGSYGAAMALAHTSNALSHAANMVSNMPDGGLAITGQFVNRVQNVVISPNQTFNFQTLVPRGAEAGIKLIFKDLNTNQIFDLTR